jgi:hypothetical protein
MKNIYWAFRGTDAEPGLPEKVEANDAVEERTNNKNKNKNKNIQPLLVTAPRPPSAAPLFCSAPFSMVPSSCCVSGRPFQVGKKPEHHNRKHDGGGRKGRPPKQCAFNCQGQRSK